VNTEKSLGFLNRCRDIVIFKLLGCRPPAYGISLDLWNGPNSHEGQTASPCQISSKSVKPRPRYGDYSIFQDGGRRHLGFLKFEIFNGRNGLEGRTASISSKSHRRKLILLSVPCYMLYSYGADNKSIKQSPTRNFDIGYIIAIRCKTAVICNLTDFSTYNGVSYTYVSYLPTSLYAI